MSTHLDWSSLTAAGLSYADWSLCCPVSTHLPLSVSRRQLPFSVSFVQLSDSRSLPTSGHVEISSPNPLSGFAPKQTKESSAWQTTYIVSHGVLPLCWDVVDVFYSPSHSALRKVLKIWKCHFYWIEDTFFITISLFPRKILNCWKISLLIGVVAFFSAQNFFFIKNLITFSW